MSIMIINERRFPLSVSVDANTDMLPYYRWEHRVTLGYKGRTFMVFIDTLMTKIYVEEITTGDSKQIKDDDEWKELAGWAKENGFMELQPPLLKPAPPRFV